MSQDSNLTPRNITYRQMINTFSKIAKYHKNINSFHSGQLDDVDIDKKNLSEFPLMYVEPEPVSVDAQTMTYSFTVIIADQLNEDASEARVNYPDLTTTDDAYTETLLILKDVIANFRQSIQTKSYADQRTSLSMPISLSPFTSRFANLLTGWAGTFNIVCQNENDLCSVPQTMSGGQ